MKKHIFIFLLTVFLIIACKEKHENANRIEATTEIIKPQLADAAAAEIDSLIIKLARKSNTRVTAIIANDSIQDHYVGFDGRENKLITDFTDLNEIGSNTKLLTATSILQLVEQNKLSLEDPLTKILPLPALNELLIIDGTNYIDSIKVVNLLNHTSGLPEYFIEHDDEKEIELHGDSTLVFTNNDLISMAKEHQTDPFIPGSKFRYCNTNYILLGMIIDKISGQTYQDYFQEHIINKLDLKNTYLGTVNVPKKRAQGHFKGKDSYFPFTIAGAAGEAIMDLDDMEQFINAWYKGELFKNTATMTSLLEDHYNEMGSGITYGMGVINLFNTSYGHAGQTFGFISFMCSLPNGYRFAFVIDDASIPAWEFAISLTSYLSKLN